MVLPGTTHSALKTAVASLPTSRCQVLSHASLSWRWFGATSGESSPRKGREAAPLLLLDPLGEDGSLERRRRDGVGLVAGSGVTPIALQRDHQSSHRPRLHVDLAGPAPAILVPPGYGPRETAARGPTKICGWDRGCRWRSAQRAIRILAALGVITGRRAFARRICGWGAGRNGRRGVDPIW
jgi:hypothetical protein